MANPSRFTKIGYTANKAMNTYEPYKQMISIPLPVVASGAEQTTTVTLPARAVVTNTVLNVITAEATGTTKTIDVGLDTAGAAVLGNDLSVAATGSKIGLTGVVADGDTVTYTLGSANYAELVAELIIEYIAADA